MRPAHQQFRIGRRPNVARNARIVELYQAGLSSTEVARRVGTTAANVLQLLKRANVPTRSLAESMALAKRRAERRRLIAEAAQRAFGHLHAPKAAPVRAVKPPPVNAMFDDVVLAPGWEEL